MTALPAATPKVKRTKKQGVAAASTGGGVQLYQELPGGGFDPLNWPQDAVGGVTGAVGSVVGGAASSVASGVWKSVEPFLATTVFVVAGLGLMILGASKALSPQTTLRDRYSKLRLNPSDVQDAAGAAAVAA